MRQGAGRRPENGRRDRRKRADSDLPVQIVKEHARVVEEGRALPFRGARIMRRVCQNLRFGHCRPSTNPWLASDLTVVSPNNALGSKHVGICPLSHTPGDVKTRECSGRAEKFPVELKESPIFLPLLTREIPRYPFTSGL